MKRTFIVITAIISVLFVGFLASRFQAESLETWYPTLNKPSLTPPDSVFPIVWTILYVFMGLSIGLIVCCKSVKENMIIGLFTVQMILNFLWSILFFYLQNPVMGLIDIILLDIVLIIYAVKTYNESRISSILFFPYILWVTFAAYLNLYIVIYN